MPKNVTLGHLDANDLKILRSLIAPCGPTVV